MNFLAFFIILVIYKSLSNLLKYLRVKKLYKEYYAWLAEQDKEDTFTTHRNEILQLFKNAGVKDSYIPMTQPMGYGQIAQFSASVFNNLTHKNKHIAASVDEKFLEVIGIYRKRCIDSFNIFYWIDLIIWLPKSVINYLGLSSENIFTKTTQLLWWLITPIGLLFREQFVEWLQSIFST